MDKLNFHTHQTERKLMKFFCADEHDNAYQRHERGQGVSRVVSIQDRIILGKCKVAALLGQVAGGNRLVNMSRVHFQQQNLLYMHPTIELAWCSPKGFVII